MVTASRSQPKWIAVYYRDTDDHLESTSNRERFIGEGLPDPAPAREFIESCPKPVRAAIRARIAAVRDYPPPRFPTSTPMWSLMHKPKTKKDVDMSGIFEVRDKHDKLLYRVFCVLDSQGPSNGLSAPALVMLSGTVKRKGEEVPQAIYREVRRQANRYFSLSPRPTVVEPI